MDLGLKDRLVLITGSTAGIGFAAAAAFAQEGARVVINGRNETRVRAAVEKLGGNATGVAADVGTADGCAKIIAAFPDVEILVNNAGIFEPRAFEELRDEEWAHFFEVNVMSGVRLSRHYFPRMLKQDRGRIIFISSESGVQIPAEMIHYGMTKSAQISVARGLAERTKGTRVTVNSVLPGPTSSEGVATFVDELAKSQGVSFEQMEREFFKNARPSSLLRRFSTPEEVANMIVYVASDRASATNGAALRVEGGVVRGAF